MKFNVFLRWVVPGYRLHKERLYMYRKFLCAHFKATEFYRTHRLSDPSQRKTCEQLADDHIDALTKQGHQEVPRPCGERGLA
jgi:hypothetical protein